MTRQKWNVYWVSLIAALAGMLFGYGSGIISGALLYMKKDYIMTTRIQEWMVAIILVGAMLGSFGSGRLTDQIGRKKSLMAVALLFIFGTCLASISSSIDTIFCGRFFIGLAIGIGSFTAPLYIAETAPTHMRGGLVSLNQLMISLGIFVSYIINYTFSGFEHSWRWMFAAGIIPAILLGIGIFMLPESPRWLLKHGKEDKARKSLMLLRDFNTLEEEVASIRESLVEHPQRTGELFSRRLMPVLLVGVMLGIFQQITGINTIIYYAPTIFQEAGFTKISTAILATAGVGLVNLVATFFSVKFLDIIGRRPLLLTGLVGMAISLTVLSLAFHFKGSSSELRWIAITSIFAYIACFAFSLGTILWLLISEIFPLRVRGLAMGLSVASCWLSNLLVSSTFLTLLDNLGPSRTFLLFGLSTLLAFICCYLWVPETRGVSLETIENNIYKGNAVREIGQPHLDSYLTSIS